MQHEPPLQFEPIADNETGRFVQGVDRGDFRSLGSRLIPCGHFHSAHAVDLAWRVWWWDAKTQWKAGSEYPGTDYWYLVDDDHATKVLREVEQWRRVAPPLALEHLHAFLSENSFDKRASLWQRIMDLQDALLMAWEVHPRVPIWRLGFFYRTITLDGRWLLTEHEIPPFDVAFFAQLLPKPVADAGRDPLRGHLMNDPVTSRMPELFQNIAGSPPADTSRGLLDEVLEQTAAGPGEGAVVRGSH